MGTKISDAGVTEASWSTLIKIPCFETGQASGDKYYIQLDFVGMSALTNVLPDDLVVVQADADSAFYKSKVSDVTKKIFGITENASRDVATTDFGKLIEVDTSGGVITFDVPSDTNLGGSVDDVVIMFVQKGASKVVVQGKSGQGVTINAISTATAPPETVAQYADPLVIWHTATADTWLAWGGLG